MAEKLMIVQVGQDAFEGSFLYYLLRWFDVKLEAHLFSSS